MEYTVNIGNAIVLVENGYVINGVKDGRVVYPFRWSKKLQGWDNVSGRIKVQSLLCNKSYQLREAVNG